MRTSSAHALEVRGSSKARYECVYVCEGNNWGVCVCV